MVVARQVTIAGLSKRYLTHNCTCIKEICAGTFCYLNEFLVLVNCYLVFCWFAPCSQANQPMIQKFEETWCVKLSSYRTFHGITDLSFRSNFNIHCHFKILGLTRTAILIVKLSGCRYIFGRNASVSCICQFRLRPATPPPPRATPVSPEGGAFFKFCAARGPGICQPRGHSQAFDTHAVSYQNITTQRILLGKKAGWLNCQGEEKIDEGCKGVFLILYMHFFTAYQVRIT